jgi:Tol biopolymer transport system component
MKIGRIIISLTAIALVIGIGPGAERSQAQYFGQNKIIYQNFKFRVLKTEHFDIYYYPEEEPAVADAARMAERWYARHEKILGHGLNGRQPLILYASSPQFGETNVVQGQIGEGTGGVTEALKRRIVLPFAGPLAETNHVIGHELVHAFQYSITAGKGTSQGFPGASIDRLPLWFVEGMAEFLSLGPNDANTAMWMRDATKSMKKLPSVDALGNPEYFPYRWGQALLAFIAGKWGDDKIAALLNVAGRSGNIDDAIQTVLKIKPDSLSKEWHKALHDAYDPLVKVTKSPSDYGSEVISRKHGGGDLNVGPVISPDGKNLIFFSEKSLFAIDLYLADAETGKVKKAIVRTELDPHYSSLEFIYSAGAWSPDGNQIVYSSVVKDRPAIDILDITRDKVVREIHFKNLDEIYNPSWSPDGQKIAFSALKGGFSDIFIYDLETNALRQMTDDAYADLQPAWSPDGTQLAFVTDRFTTDLADLNIGRYELALMNAGTGEIVPLHIFQKGKEINPQWSPDGTSLYFVSDQNGISDIYRYNLNDTRVYRVTNLYAGTAGITDISPAISVASKTNRLVFSAYEDGKYNIYRVDSLNVLTGEPLDTSKAELAEASVPASPTMLPPVDQTGGKLLELLDDPNFGLPPDTTHYAAAPYHPNLGLEFVGQPYLAAGVDPLGVQLGGGVALFWGDMLGDRSLVTAMQLQTGGGFTNFGGLLGYENDKHRWNWGAAIQQVPYTLSQYVAGYDSLNGSLVYVQQLQSFRQLNREVSGIASYPFDRTKRVEFSAGYDYVGFSQKVQTQIFDANSGALLSDQTQSLPSPPGINLFSASAAFVFDNAVYGAVDPILGQRARFQVQPAYGTIKFYTFIADFRKYIMPIRPFTLAFRLLHYGRYGSGADDYRLTPLFIGYQDLVRGYDAGSFSAADTTFYRLLGSKMAVANVELRFPLLGLLGIGHGYYGFLPLETGFFYDAGVAWSAGQKPSFISGGTQKPVQSYGVMARLNLLGYVVLEVDYVKPVNRTDRGAYWQFDISPGF